MTTPLESLVATGTKLWLDSVDPDLVKENRKFGATGRHLEPDHHFRPDQDGPLRRQNDGVAGKRTSDEEIAWEMTDFFVRQAQAVFADVNASTKGNDGYVSFELDPLLEDASCKLSVRREGGPVCRAGQEMGGRAHQPHDQSPRHARRAGGA